MYHHAFSPHRSAFLVLEVLEIKDLSGRFALDLTSNPNFILLFLSNRIKKKKCVFDLRLNFSFNTEKMWLHF